VARHTGGWVKLWRVSLEKDLFHNIYLWAIWHALLHMAVWKETQIIWRGRQRRLPPGSVVFGIREFAERWDCSQRTISKWLKYLHDTQRIVLETCAQGTVATICNWEKYQGGEDFLFAPSAHEVGAKYEPSRSEVGLKEEGKNLRREEVSLAPLSADAIAEAIEEWGITLKHFGIDRKISAHDQTQLARAIQAHGIEAVRLAIRGARYESASENFNPKQHLSLARIFGRDRQGNLRVEKFINLGAQNKPRSRETHAPNLEAPC
jgi:hypothetical protein